MGISGTSAASGNQARSSSDPAASEDPADLTEALKKGDQTSRTSMAFSGQTSEHDSHPVQYVGIATVTLLSSRSKTILGQMC
jgi:hypothetical protein